MVRISTTLCVTLLTSSYNLSKLSANKKRSLAYLMLFISSLFALAPPVVCYRIFFWIQVQQQGRQYALLTDTKRDLRYGCLISSMVAAVSNISWQIFLCLFHQDMFYAEFLTLFHVECSQSLSILYKICMNILIHITTALCKDLLVNNASPAPTLLGNINYDLLICSTHFRYRRARIIFRKISCTCDIKWSPQDLKLDCFGMVI